MMSLAPARPGAARIHHQERRRHRRVDHRAVLRDAVEVEAGLAAPILDAELPAGDAAHRVAGDAEPRQIEPRRERRPGAPAFGR